MFNPTPAIDYGKCSTCDESMPTEEDANIHMFETFKAAISLGKSRGHAIKILNPSRVMRIQRGIDRIIDDAISDAMEEIDALINSDSISEEEAKEALNCHPDFANAWEEYYNE